MVRPVGFTCREVVPTGRQRIHVLFCVNCWCDVLASSVPRPLGVQPPPPIPYPGYRHMPNRYARPYHTIIPFHNISYQCGAVVQPPHGRGGLDFPLASHASHTARRRRDPVCVVFVCPPTVHTPARRGGCTGSDPGLTRGMATLNRVCERGTRCMSRASQRSMRTLHENEKRKATVTVTCARCCSSRSI